MPEGNRVPATVTFVRDVGPTRDIYFDTPLGSMIVEYALGEKPRAFAVGQSTELHLPPAALFVYPAMLPEKSAA